MADEGDAARSSRIHEYKNKGKDEDYMRTKRRDHNVELRKQSRADQMLKKRMLDGAPEPEALSMEQANTLLQQSHNILEMSNDPLERELAVLVHGIMDDSNPEYQHECTKLCRKMVSKAVSPPIKAVVNTGIVPKIVQMLAWDDKPNIQFEAAWVLTNIASGQSSETLVVYNAGALPHLLRLLQSENTEVREQAVWALGNIVGDGSMLRDKVLAAGGLELVMGILQRADSSIGVIRNATWTLSNFCRGKDPRPNFAHVSTCFGMLLQLVKCNDSPTQVDAAWAVAYISDNNIENLQVILDTGVHHSLAEILSVTQNPDLILPVLRALGNITTGSNEQTQEIIGLNVVPLFAHIMVSHPDNIRKEAAWVISNIAAGTPAQIQYLLNCDIVKTLIRAADDGDARVRKEVSWALVNMVYRGTVEQCTAVVDHGALPALINLLSNERHILDGIKAILQAGQHNGRLQEYKNLMESRGSFPQTGVEKLELICSIESSNQAVTSLAAEIIDTYFSSEDDVGPVPDQNAFAFGAPVAPSSYHF
jgi:HEAT repeat protein